MIEMIDAAAIIDAVDIVQYIGQFVELEQHPDLEYWGCTPLRTTPERTPSFSVNPEKKCWYCFSTGKSGSVIDFVMLYKHCSFYRALCILKEYAGIEGEIAPLVRLTSTSVAKKFRFSKAQKQIAQPKPFSLNHMSTYEWNPDKFQAWIDEGISLDIMQKYQVRYDSFSNRIVYPIRNLNGDIVNICGRIVDPEYKEKHLAKYIYLNKWGGAPDIVWGLYEHRNSIHENKSVILFEGMKSCLKAEMFGFENTGAILTSHLSDNQLRTLIKVGGKVIFALDAEIDVRKDANIMKLKKFVDVEVVINRDGLLLDKDSPVDSGPEVWKQLYERRVRLV